MYVVVLFLRCVILGILERTERTNDAVRRADSASRNALIIGAVLDCSLLRFVFALRAVFGECNNTRVYEQVSDFRGDLESVRLLANSGLDVYAHNVETVERLQKFVRDPRAGYAQSLSTLEEAKLEKPGLYTKTSIMLGLGETDEEVVQTMKDLCAIDVDVVKFCQYIWPTEKHLSVVEYVTPETFDYFCLVGEKMGFKYIDSGPTVQSSYKVGEFYLEHIIKTEHLSA